MAAIKVKQQRASTLFPEARYIQTTGALFVVYFTELPGLVL
jgi:hypothetical protein